MIAIDVTVEKRRLSKRDGRDGTFSTGHLSMLRKQLKQMVTQRQPAGLFARKCAYHARLALGIHYPFLLAQTLGEGAGEAVGYKFFQTTIPVLRYRE